MPPFPYVPPGRKHTPSASDSRVYEMPYFGQPFKRVQNEHVVEYGACNGVKVTGKRPDGSPEWTATIASGVSGTFRIFPNQKVGTDGWEPLTPEEIAAFRGNSLLGDAVGMQAFNDLAEKFADFSDGVKSRIESLQSANENLAVESKALKDRLAVLENRATTAPPVVEPPVEAKPNGGGRPQLVVPPPPGRA